MEIIGTAASNAEIEFEGPLSNIASGFITAANALLRFDGTLTNSGPIALSAGSNHLFGDIANDSGGTIVVSGGSNATFYDDVDNAGTIQVSVGCTVVFFGALSGSGSFTGSGTWYLEGDLRPGASPAVISFGGDVIFGSAAGFEAELTGTNMGKFDRVEVTGDAALDGTLTAALPGTFVPLPGDSFEVMTFGSRDGEFADAGGIDNVGGYGGLWLNLVYDADSLTLVAAATAGDADLDADVDFDDFSMLAFHFGSSGVWTDGDFDLDGDVDFDDFSALAFNFGTTGAGAVGAGTVPEPAAVALLALGGLALLRRKRRQAACDRD
jgi:hypothetical protein